MIERFEFNFPFKDSMRKIHLYVPPYYYETDERYPVMYMFDGHNLFDDNYATYGTSWGLESHLDQSDLDMIVVGIECPHEGESRLSEYAPCHFESPWTSQIINGYGDKFMDWVIYHLKPFIDANYRTLPMRETTAVGGSSMGGLMALFTGIAYNRFVSKVACLSRSIGFCREYLRRGMQQVDVYPDTRVYFSYGEEEMKNHNMTLDDAQYFSQAFQEEGAETMIHVQPKGKHNEASWANQNQIYLDFLWKENATEGIS